jgi:molybdate transport system substrate-binding protein
VHDALAPRLVQGNNIAQTYQFVETGNAELGFVALSQIVRHAEGSRWLVPNSLHAPIAQDAVLLRRGADSEAARAFLAFLRGPEGRAVVEKFGYGAGE